MERVVILFSGGLDSYLMWRYARSQGMEVTCVNYDIGQPYNWKEARATALLGVPVATRKVEWLGGSVGGHGKEGSASGSIYIPGRNLILSALGACQSVEGLQPTDSLTIWLGALKGEIHAGATDKNMEFAEQTSALLSYVLSPYVGSVRVEYPFANMSKFDICARALAEWGVTFEEMHTTSSCLEAEEGNCGRCVVCLRRWGIFTQLGCPEVYNVDPLSVPENQAIIAEMRKGDASYYDKARRDEIMPAVLMQENKHA